MTIKKNCKYCKYYVDGALKCSSHVCMSHKDASYPTKLYTGARVRDGFINNVK